MIQGAVTLQGFRYEEHASSNGGSVCLSLKEASLHGAIVNQRMRRIENAAVTRPVSYRAYLLSRHIENQFNL